jgi:hypothetical protein
MDSVAVAKPTHEAVAADVDGLNALLQEAGHIAASSVQDLPGGRNNRVFRVITSNGEVLLKIYFLAPGDPRDRLRHEYDFCKFACAHGVDSVARPLARDRERRWAIYEFVNGTKLTLPEVNESHARAAANFVLGMSANRMQPDAVNLLPASEACFSLAEHLQRVRSRIERLASMDDALPVDRLARESVEKEVIPAFDEAERRLKDSGLPLDKELSREHRCLSPSDFGFHNAILKPDGKFCFVDFEFAGWDDPAKLISDFANQPDMLLPEKICTLFREAMLNEGGFGDELATRLKYVEPLYQIKWSCICLNDFLPFGRSRRSFIGNVTEETHKHFQLERARCMAARALKNLAIH